MDSPIPCHEFQIHAMCGTPKTLWGPSAPSALCSTEVVSSLFYSETWSLRTSLLWYVFDTGHIPASAARFKLWGIFRESVSSVSSHLHLWEDVPILIQILSVLLNGDWVNSESPLTLIWDWSSWHLISLVCPLHGQTTENMGTFKYLVKPLCVCWKN